MSSKAASAPRPSGPTGITRAYLFLYNLLNFLAWGYTVVYTASFIPENATKKDLGAVFNNAFDVLWYTQLIAGMEIVHSVFGIVRAPFFTTAMQVASRLLVTIGILQQFGATICGQSTAQIGDYAYIGCVFAWGITEVIRYGYFAITLSGSQVPKWWTWLRYNTFYILYPIGISSECTLIYQALGPAASSGPLEQFGYSGPAYKYFLILMLVIYVPGKFIISK